MKGITIKVANECINAAIKHHSKPEIKLMVSKDFAKGFLAALKFTKKYIINCRDLQEDF